MYQCINHKSHTFHFSTKSQARQFFLGWPRHHDIIVHFPGMQHRRRSLVHQHLRLQHGGVQALAALAASHHNQRPSEAYKKWHHRGCQGLPRFDSTTMTVFEKKKTSQKWLRMYVIEVIWMLELQMDFNDVRNIYGYNLASCWQCPSLTHWIHLFWN